MIPFTRETQETNDKRNIVNTRIQKPHNTHGTGTLNTKHTTRWSISAIVNKTNDMDQIESAIAAHTHWHSLTVRYGRGCGRVGPARGPRHSRSTHVLYGSYSGESPQVCVGDRGVLLLQACKNIYMLVIVESRIRDGSLFKSLASSNKKTGTSFS